MAENEDLEVDLSAVKLEDKDVVIVMDSRGNSIHMLEYDGYFLARNTIERGISVDFRTNIPKIVNMEVRPDDVFLIAYPKAGTHWTMEIICMLLKGKAEYHKNQMQDHVLPYHTPETLNKMPSPRILNSHMMFRHLPRDILRKRNKICFLNRNPKDIAVSYYHHCCKQALEYKGSWQDFLQFFMSERVMYHSPWYRYVLDWEKCIKEHPELDILYVTYEDLIKDPVKEIERIAEFLDVKSSQELYTKVAENCNIKLLRQNYESRKGSRRHIFRKGGVGGWKDWFTVSQNEQFDKYLKEKLNNSSLWFTYELENSSQIQ